MRTMGVVMLKLMMDMLDVADRLEAEAEEGQWQADVLLCVELAELGVDPRDVL